MVEDCVFIHTEEGIYNPRLVGENIPPYAISESAVVGEG